MIDFHLRFGGRRPGLELMAVENAAVPVTVVMADAIVQDRKPLPLLEEFVLRLTHAGIDSASTMADALGLAPGQVSGTAASQVVVGNLRYQERSQNLSLTAQGLESVRTLEAIQPIQRQLPLVFDRIVWSLVDFSRSQLLTKAQADEEGLIILPPARSSKIELADVTPRQINALLARRADSRKAEVLRVRKVTRSAYRYMPVQLLVYGEADRGEVQLAMCLDGDLSPEHDSALQRLNVIERLKIAIAPAEERPSIPENLEEIRLGSEEVAEIRSLSTANSEAISPEASIPSLDTVPVRSISVFEHPALLEKSLLNSRRRLLIISPWVKRGVATTNFIARLESCLRRGVKVHIAHGYGSTDEGSDADALRRLQNLQRRFPELFVFARLKNTHAKILISDDTWISTSFNWLSFRGDPDRTYRMEEGTMVKIPAEAEKAYARYTQIIDEQRIG